MLQVVECRKGIKMRNYKDLSGNRYGKLYVIERNYDIKRKNSVWKCRCDCGNYVNVEKRDLEYGYKTSCGCSKKMHPSFVDLTGKRFGRLTVINRIDFKNGITIWSCVCDCGTICDVSTNSLNSGKKQSCGCLQKERTIKASTTHGLSKTRIHKEWRGILHRCENPSASHYENYGGRGITVCDEWKEDFMAFYEWSMKNGYADNLTLDRKDNNKGYSPDNCRWVTHMENCHNRGKRKDCKSLHSGVRRIVFKSGNVKYRATIGVNYQTINLGYFDTEEEAVKARIEAEEKYWGKKEGGLNE